MNVACRAGHCTACGKLIWRAALAARDNGPNIRGGQQFILWPDPTSVYARLETETGHAPGIAFCAEHKPAAGDHVLAGFGPVVGLDTAHQRYAAWYNTSREHFYRAWLRDALTLEPAPIEAIIAQWKADAGDHIG